MFSREELLSLIAKADGQSPAAVLRVFETLQTLVCIQDSIPSLMREREEIRSKYEELMARNQAKIDEWQRRCPHPHTKIVLGSGGENSHAVCSCCGKTIH